MIWGAVCPLMVASLVACGADDAGAPDGHVADSMVDGAADSGIPRDATMRPALAEASAFLSSERYDCTAAGPFLAPTRPAPRGCYRDPACEEPLVTAHRIAVPFAPENSLSALRSAILLGLDIVETDIRLTSDGTVVLLHDSDVDRTLDGTGEISSMTLAAVQALPMRVPPELDGDFVCDRIPTLPEVFAIARGQIVVEFEVKDLSAGVRAAEYLRDNELYDDAFLLCDPEECLAARAAVPDVPIMTRPHSVEEVADALAFAPTPAMVHIDPGPGFLNTETVSRIHAAGAKVYASAFGEADIQAVLLDDVSGYPAMFGRGIDVLQVQYAHWALMSVGRLPAP